MPFVKCPHCKYVWQYKGIGDMPTCSKCARKFNAKNNIISPFKAAKELANREYLFAVKPKQGA